MLVVMPRASISRNLTLSVLLESNANSLHTIYRPAYSKINIQTLCGHCMRLLALESIGQVDSSSMHDGNSLNDWPLYYGEEAEFIDNNGPR